MVQQMAIQQQLLSVQQQHLLNLQRQGLLSVPSALSSALPQGNNTSLPHDMKQCYENVYLQGMHPKGSGGCTVVFSWHSCSDHFLNLIYPKLLNSTGTGYCLLRIAL